MSASGSRPDNGHTSVGDSVDEAGHAVVAMVQRAGTLSLEDRLQLRAAEDRIQQLEGEVKHLEDRATRAGRWLSKIKREIEEKLIGAMEANRPNFPVT
jgi:uncharacterized protein YigA (DUF484 family)